MFMMHISSLLAYSVLLASTVLVIWALRNKGVGSFLGKIVGSSIFVLSIISVLCISYSGIKYWSQGNFEKPMCMNMGMHQGMMGKMMPQMMGNMEHMGHMGNVENKERMEEKNEEDHP